MYYYLRSFFYHFYHNCLHTNKNYDNIIGLIIINKLKNILNLIIKVKNI